MFVCSYCTEQTNLLPFSLLFRYNVLESLRRKFFETEDEFTIWILLLQNLMNMNMYISAFF